MPRRRCSIRRTTSSIGSKIVPDNFAGYTYLGFQKLLRQGAARTRGCHILVARHAPRGESVACLTTMQSAALDGETLKEINQALSEAGLPPRKAEVARRNQHASGLELSQCQKSAETTRLSVSVL